MSLFYSFRRKPMEKKEVTFEELEARALTFLGDRQLSENTSAGCVSCALVTEAGNIYEGVCLDCPCGIGFCAEHTAISSMVTQNETRILKIVAISENGIIPPCGRCRELMRQVDERNLDTIVKVKSDLELKLSDLLPHPF